MTLEGSPWRDLQLRIGGGWGEGGQGGHGPRPVKHSHKKMAAERGGLYFMFLGPHSSEVSGSTTDLIHSNCI